MILLDASGSSATSEQEGQKENNRGTWSRSSAEAVKDRKFIGVIDQKCHRPERRCRQDPKKPVWLDGPCDSGVEIAKTQVCDPIAQMRCDTRVP